MVHDMTNTPPEIDKYDTHKKRRLTKKFLSLICHETSDF